MSMKRALIAFAGGTSAGIIYYNLKTPIQSKREKKPISTWTPPTRSAILNNLKSNEEYDILIIGGGATGTGCALDAATRGLKTACVERDDFSSGTSSRSTKLVHGGVRYLEKAFKELDYGQFKVVKEALHERTTFLQIAPYLTNSLPIMLPIYKWHQVPYFWVGAKVYDLIAGSRSLESSFYLSKTRALKEFPMLKSENLKGAMVYYDGQHNDSRMNVMLGVTAIKHGADVANYVEVVSLLKNTEGSLVGVRVKDRLTNEEWEIKAKGIVNATGPFTGK